MADVAAKETTDHDSIRKWAEERGGHPATVEGTGAREKAGILRIDYPGYRGKGRLREISWDEFFRKFDEEGLALLYQEKTATRRQSRFSKLVSRDSRQRRSA